MSMKFLSFGVKKILDATFYIFSAERVGQRLKQVVVSWRQFRKTLRVTPYQCPELREALRYRDMEDNTVLIDDAGHFETNVDSSLSEDSKRRHSWSG